MIGRDINSSFSNPGIEQGASHLIEQELQLDKDKRENNRKSTKSKKKDSDKATSVLMADKDIAIEDLVDKTKARQARDTLAKGQKDVAQAIVKQMEREEQAIISDIRSNKPKDVVKISSQATQAKQPSLEKEYDLKEDKRSNRLQKDRIKDEKASRSSNLASKETQIVKDTKEGRTTDSSKKMYRRYISAYTDSIMTNNKQKSRESSEMRESLRSRGFSHKKLSRVELGIRQMMKKEIKKQIKNSFIELSMNFSSEKLSRSIIDSSAQYYAYLNLADDSGLDRDKTLESTSRQEAKEELRDFISSELDESIMKTKIKTDSPQALIKAFNRFNKISNIAHFDAGKYFSSLNTKLNDWGLTQFSGFEKGVLDTDKIEKADKDGGGQGGSSDGSNQEEDIEQLEDQLRILIMQKAVIRSPIRSVELRFKINKLVSVLKGTGKVDGKRIKKLQDEGNGIAKIKLINMVRESYEERAALEEYKGPKYTMVKNKFKNAMKGLKKIGASLNRKELDEMRDEINKGMFSLVKEEYLKIDFYLEKDPKNVSLLNREKVLFSMLERLKEESNILEEVKVSMFNTSNAAESGGNVIEAA